MRNALIFAAALLAMAPLAAGAATQPAYTYAGISFSKASTDGMNGGKGYQLDGSFGFADTWFLEGGYTHHGFDSVLPFPYGGQFDNQYRVGGGFHLPLGVSTDFVTRISYAHEDASNDFGSVNNSGYALAAGIRSLVTENLELNVFLGNDNIGWVNHDPQHGNETTLSAGALYSLSTNLALGASYARASNDSAGTWMLTGRWNF